MSNTTTAKISSKVVSNFNVTNESIQVLVNNTTVATNGPNQLVKLNGAGLIDPALIGPISSGVTTVNGRNGNVTLTAADITSGTFDNSVLPAALVGHTYDGLTNAALSVGFSIAGGTTSKTLTVDNNITIAGVDGSTVATLDQATGKLNLTQMPEIAIVSYLGTVDSQDAMTSIGTPPTGLPSGVIGDWTIRSDIGTSWILIGTDQTVFANWLQMSYPPVSVTSVAGRTGNITLFATDIGGLATSATTDTTNASNITSGTLSNSRIPNALTGHTYDGLTNTALDIGFTIAGGTTSKILTINNTLAFSGTDTSTLNIANGGTLVASAFSDTTNATNITSGTLSNSRIPNALTGHTYDGLTNTALNTGFMIAGGTTSKSLTVNNTLYLAGVDTSILNIGNGGTLVTSAYSDTTNATNITSGTLSNSRLPYALNNHTYDGLTNSALSNGFAIAGGTTSKTLTINNTLEFMGTDGSTLNINNGGTLVASAYSDTTNASNITTGTLSNALLPVALNGHTFDGLTNTALSIGFTVAGGTTSKTLTVNNSIGLTGTDTSTLNIGNGGTLAASAYSDTTNASNITSGTLNNSRLPVALIGQTYNGLTNTALSTGYSIAGGTTSKTLTVNNSVGLSGTDSTTYQLNNIPSATSGVTAGSYTNTSITVNTQGIVTSATSGQILPWSQLGATINGITNNYLGYGCAMSGDGLTIAFSVNTGTNTSYIATYTSSGSTWMQSGSNIMFTSSGLPPANINVALNFNGTVLVISQPSYSGSGSVVVYSYSGSSWSVRGSPITSLGINTDFGTSVAINVDGTIIAIGAPAASSNAGTVQVWQWSGSAWVQLGANITFGTPNSFFGASITLSHSGFVVAAGAPYADSNFGAVAIYSYNGSSWVQLGSNIIGSSAIYSGGSVQLSANGTMIAIGSAPYNYNGNALYGSGTLLTTNTGFVTMYQYTGSLTWVQSGNQLSGSSPTDNFGTNIDMSGDGKILIVSAPNTGNGYVNVYQYNGTFWLQNSATIYGLVAGELFGTAFGINTSGSMLAIGAPLNTSGGSNAGNIRMFYNFSFMSQRPRGFINAYSVTTQTNTTAGTFQPITFDIVTASYGWGYSSAGFTCFISGVYKLIVNAELSKNSSATTFCEMRFLNGANEIPGSEVIKTITNAGDCFETSIIMVTTVAAGDIIIPQWTSSKSGVGQILLNTNGYANTKIAANVAIEQIY